MAGFAKKEYTFSHTKFVLKTVLSLHVYNHLKFSMSEAIHYLAAFWCKEQLNQYKGSTVVTLLDSNIPGWERAMGVLNMP